MKKTHSHKAEQIFESPPKVDSSSVLPLTYSKKDYKKIKKTLIIILIVIIVINILILIFSYSISKSYILKINKNAYIFAHGTYIGNFKFKINNQTAIEKYYYPEILKDYVYKNGTDLEIYHMTYLNKDEKIRTIDLLNNLRKQGYTKIWISMCEQGNSEYIYEDNETKILWGNDVDRIKTPGTIYPIFYGLGIYRFVK